MSGHVSRRAVLGAGIAAVPVLSSGVAWAGDDGHAGDGTLRVTDPGSYISFAGGAFSLVGASVAVSADDHPGVVRVAGDLWVVNVGDLKGNELPTEFFLNYAWNPDRWGFDSLEDWERRYARQNFGVASAGPIAELLAEYGQLQARRKP